jgi:hypothetical protein
MSNLTPTLPTESKSPALPPDHAVRRKNVPETLPKPLPGVVCPQWVRCGRPRCGCSRGGRLHGPYQYRFWREGGRLRKAYVRPADLEHVRARCEARRQARQEIRAAWDDWRRLAAALRGLEGR